MKKFLAFFICSLFIILFFPASSFAEIYKWVDADGKTHFGDDKDAKTSIKKEATPPVVVEIPKPNAYKETKPTAEELQRRQQESEKNKPGNKEKSGQENNDDTGR
jgi:hypothetical protein